MVDRPHTSPQPTRGDGQLKINLRKYVWLVPLWPVDTIEWFQVVASLKSIKFNPLIFSPSGPCFWDILQLSLDWHRHLAIILHTFTSSHKWPKTGVKFWELLRCKVTGGPKWGCFRKHLATLHQKIEKWPKTGGKFWKLLQQNVVFQQKMHFW